VVHRKAVIFLAMLTGIAAAFSTTGSAADRHPKSKSKPLSPLPPGPQWADTNKDGQLNNDEAKRAAQILKDKIKKAKTETTKPARK
jgi:hypothetical protein